MGVRACTASQVNTWWSVEDFYYTVNPLGHCWECNQPGHVRIKCPDLGLSRTSYRGGQDEDVRCYNYNKNRHCSRDCRLPNRTRKDQEPVLTEDKFRKICMKVITETINQEKIISYIMSVLCSIE